MSCLLCPVCYVPPATASVGAVNLITTACSAYLVDKMGRKVLLEIGTTCMAVALGCLAVVLLTLNSVPTAQGILAVLAVLLYVVGYAVGLGAVCWVVLSEIMSQRLRSKAFGLFVSINWGINLIIGLLTLLAIDGLGGTEDSMDDDEKDDAQKKGENSNLNTLIT
jgi:MFS family permease